RLLLFDIHKMAKRAPRFIEAVHRIYSAGYDMDYISDNFIRNAMCQDGKILTSGGVSYKALVVPGARLMPADVLEKLLRLADEGATIVFLEQYPEDVPGLNTLEGRRTEFNKVLAQIKEREGKGHILFGTDYARTLAATAAVPEEMKTTFGLSSIRRSHPEGHHYFISALKTEDTENWIPLAVQARSAMLYNPMNGTSGKARLRQNNGRTEVFLQLASGESVILKTFANQEVSAPEYGYWTPVVQNDVKKTSPVTYSFTDKWGFRFVEASPAVAATPDSVSLGSWTEIPAEGAKNVMGAACYTTTFTLKSPADVEEWMLDLGDVRESARVRINGQAVATLIAVPYRCLVGKYLRPGVNTLEVEVTNLPANRIADMDRRDVPWRIYKDANIVNIHYKKDNYGKWEPVPSGLLGPVHLIPMQTLK
ncbi:MAG: glycosyl hydrolase family 2, partial [Bacteroides sp.]|nr:glycosyl hydrolase family 2 [Bacteroides sp.]